MVIYTEFLYVSVRGIILSIKLETILHTTTHGQLTSLNTCVLRHGYIYRISVCFSYRYNSEYQTRNYIAYYDPVNVSKHMSITSWLYIQNFCMFQFEVYIILSIKLETILHTTTHGQLTSLNTCVLHRGNIDTEFLYVSVIGIILSIKLETILHI